MEKYAQKFVGSVREYLERTGLTVTAFARKIGCLERCLARWLDGTNTPSTEYVIKTADAMDVSVDYLFERCETAEYLRANPTSCFAERLAILISESGRNKRSLALQWKIEPSAITKWLQRQRLPKPDTVFQLADYFACSMDYLLGRSDVR